MRPEIHSCHGMRTLSEHVPLKTQGMHSILSMTMYTGHQLHAEYLQI